MTCNDTLMEIEVCSCGLIEANIFLLGAHTSIVHITLEIQIEWICQKTEKPQTNCLTGVVVLYSNVLHWQTITGKEIWAPIKYSASWMASLYKIVKTRRTDFYFSKSSMTTPIHTKIVSHIVKRSKLAKTKLR